MTIDGVQDVHIHHVVRALPGPVKVATVAGAKILDEEAVGGVVLEISPAAAEFLFVVPIPKIQQTVLAIADLRLQVRGEHGVQEGVIPEIPSGVGRRCGTQDSRGHHIVGSQLCQQGMFGGEKERVQSLGQLRRWVGLAAPGQTPDGVRPSCSDLERVDAIPEVIEVLDLFLDWSAIVAAERKVRAESDPEVVRFDGETLGPVLPSLPEAQCQSSGCATDGGPAPGMSGVFLATDQVVQVVYLLDTASGARHAVEKHLACCAGGRASEFDRVKPRHQRFLVVVDEGVFQPEKGPASKHVQTEDVTEQGLVAVREGVPTLDADARSEWTMLFHLPGGQ